MSKKQKLDEAYKHLRSIGAIHTKKELAFEIDFDKTNLSSAFSGSEKYLTDGLFKKICERYSMFNIEYFLEDKGEMLSQSKENSNKIPFYDDIITVGGTSDMLAEPTTVYRPAEYIDAGDWFKDATAALRHYGDSMTEYPPGCILALKEVKDKSLLVWGKDYVIETSEYRITKRVQKGKKEGFVTAYSSNKDTYPDGRLVHEPLDVPIDNARFLLVLGYVVKKNGGSIIYTNHK
jgi:hypothetical protein